MKYIGLLSILLAATANANLMKANQAIEDENFTLAKSELTKSAQIGNSEAQFKLGVLNFQGKTEDSSKANAVAWLTLAAEYEYPQAVDYARNLYTQLSTAEKEKAKKLVGQLIPQYGKESLAQEIYPALSEKRNKRSIISNKAKKIKSGKGYYPTGSARLSNSGLISSMQRSSSSNDGATNIGNIRQQVVRPDTGMVLSQYDVGIDGRVRDPEVIFSWPKGRFDLAAHDSLTGGIFAPAKRGKNSVPQYGEISSHGYYLVGADFRTDYPQQYKRFTKYRKQADDNMGYKYLYACMLRGYQRIIADRDKQPFLPVLLEAAEGGVAAAQYDYGLYQIYVTKNLEEGIPWLIKAAKAGYMDAEYKLGDLMLNPPSHYARVKQSGFLTRDRAKAEFWLNKASEQGHLKAREKLSGLWMMKKDKSKAELSLTWLDNIDDEDKATPDTYYYMAKAYHLLDNNDDAIEQLEKAIALGQKYKWNVQRWQKLKEKLST